MGAGDTNDIISWYAEDMSLWSTFTSFFDTSG